MNPWRTFPLVRLVVPFITGIATAYSLCQDIPFTGFFYCLIISGTWLLGLLVSRKFTSYRNRWLTGMAICLLMMNLGFCLTWMTCSQTFNAGLDPPEKKGEVFIAEIMEMPRRGKKRVKLIVTLSKPDRQSGTLQQAGKALIYLVTDLESSGLQYGDRLLIFTAFNRVESASNPYGFDAKEYYRSMEVGSQAWLKTWEWKKLQNNGSSGIRKVAFVIRDRLLAIFRMNGITGQEYAVLSALLLGYTGDLDQETCNDYSASGAMHILSVSGMHVGVIYVFVIAVFGFIKRYRGGRWIHLALAVTMVWAYSILTGLSPPAYRAATMLSLVIIGKSLNRQTEVFNVIAASLFIMLISNPFLLFNTGFRFSYLAVAGIILFYQPLNNLVSTPWKITDKIWSIAAVSIAAQLATFPLGLYAFHRFPNYFLLTNLLVIPLSSLIIFGGIWVLVAGTIPVIGLYSAKTLGFLVLILNKSIHLIEQMPFSVTPDIYLAPYEMICLYLMIIAGYLFLTEKKARYLLGVLGLIILFICSMLAGKIRRYNQATMIIYQVKGASAYDFISGDRCVTLMDSAVPESSGFMDDITRRTRSAGHIRIQHKGFLETADRETLHPVSFDNFVIRSGNFICFHGTRIGWIDENVSFFPGAGIKLDYLILRHNPKINISRMVDLFHPSLIIIDSSCSWWNSEMWMKQAEKSGVACYSVGQKGALIITAGSRK